MDEVARVLRDIRDLLASINERLEGMQGAGNYDSIADLGNKLCDIDENLDRL